MNPRPTFSAPDPELVLLGACDYCRDDVFDQVDAFEDDDVIAHQSCHEGVSA